ncbi:unnamed protein product [Strongylus vulgaris]|uniref:Uncharacterized protein n=1 Tax=Strongylus vulgaris TaxID=40348 RepID=A0A3P7L168_STRVU|nr:unnamed protein product [Strongylus vulgaris]
MFVLFFQVPSDLYADSIEEDLRIVGKFIDQVGFILNSLPLLNPDVALKDVRGILRSSRSFGRIQEIVTELNTLVDLTISSAMLHGLKAIAKVSASN